MRLKFMDTGFIGPCVLALGMFDGVHAGHARLLRTAREWGASQELPVIVCTFLRHPLSVIKPEIAPPMLSTVPERAVRMAQLKVDELVVLPFDEKMRDLSPKEFVDRLVERLHPRHVVVGFNYTFGIGGEGDAKLLTAMGEKLNYQVHVLSPVKVDGHTVSSTQIRRLLSQGYVEVAQKLLERPYAISGRVIKGKGLGRTLGFPTANVAIPKGKALPAFGVYVANVQTMEDTYPAVLNIGRHPTVPEGDLTLEAHLLSNTEDLYGKKARVQFLKRLRGEEKFDSLQMLKDQMDIDSRQAKAYFGIS